MTSNGAIISASSHFSSCDKCIAAMLGGSIAGLVLSQGQVTRCTENSTLAGLPPLEDDEYYLAAACGLVPHRSHNEHEFSILRDGLRWFLGDPRHLRLLLKGDDFAVLSFNQNGLIGFRWMVPGTIPFPSNSHDFLAALYATVLGRVQDDRANS